jgi:hypothetical protein
MLKIKVTEEDKQFAKQQIKAFERTQYGKWRYTNVEAWRGIVCEMLTSKWLQQKFNVEKSAKGLDTSGIVDECDLMISGKKVEIKSATKNYFKYIMPKIYDITNKPKDIYIGVKYNETVEPNEIQIMGSITKQQIMKYPVKQNKGAPYYEIPLNDLTSINENTF